MTKVQQKQKDFQSLLENTFEDKDMVNIFKSTLLRGKYALEETMREIGIGMVEALLYMERENISGPSYSRSGKDLQKWASQEGSVYLGDRKVKIKKPRLRGPEGEVKLDLYERLKDPGQFSEELLSKVFNGLSMRRYKETLNGAGEALGVSPGSVSNRIKEATTKRLKEFTERSLKSFKIFGMFIDGIRFHGTLYIVAMGIDVHGGKKMLGFWEGATENRDVCKELLDDLERRGLELDKGVIYVTDGGSGIIKCLRERFGSDLIHQRCIIHKKNNIVGHLPKQYRAKAKKLFSDAVMCTKYHDAKQCLVDLKSWLAEINESAANSLAECIEELITIQRINVPPALRKTLRTSNPIESTFSQIREINHKVKRNRGSRMSNRWMAAMLMYAEERCQRTFGKSQIINFAKQIKGGLTTVPLPKKERKHKAA